MLIYIISVLAGSGQALDDMFMYLPDPPESSHGAPESSLRLSLLEATLRCRHLAPTAPDTLHCFPYMGHDPFLLTTTPHIYAMGKTSRDRLYICSHKPVGNQPSFESQCFTEDGVRSRLVCVPSFAESGELVLVNTHTLAAQVIKLNTKGFQKRTK
jgi:DNA polymerase delta subunit 2